MMNDCFSHPLNFPSTAAAVVNPKKKRTKLGGPGPKAARKPDPSAPKITRPCTECGKRFWSWKALFGHMRCHPERQWRGINPPPNLGREEEEEVAACLLILANQCPRKRTTEEHKCSVCLRVFSSGQALGGHKRCHRDLIIPSSSPTLDLNLPLLIHHHSSSYNSTLLDLRLGL